QFIGFFSADGVSWQQVGATSASLPISVEAGLAVTSHDTTALNMSVFDHVLVAGQNPISADIGDVGIAGEYATTGGSGFLVQGGGGDIWGTADAFNYLYEYVMNDSQMVVRVDSLDDTDRFAKAGVMFRASLDPSAAHVLVDVTPSGLVEMLTRRDTGADTRWVGGQSPTPFPIWLKLTRTPTNVIAWTSRDGNAWSRL